MAFLPPHGWFRFSTYPTTRFVGWNSRIPLVGFLHFFFRFVFFAIPLSLVVPLSTAVGIAFILAIFTFGSGFILTLKENRIRLVKHFWLFPYRIFTVPLDSLERVKIGFYSNRPDSNWLGLRDVLELTEFSHNDAFAGPDPKIHFASARTLTPLGNEIKDAVALHLNERKRAQPEKDRELLSALRNGKALPEIAALLAAGASPRAETLFGRTTLHQAAQFYHYPEIFACLLEKIGDKSTVNARDHFGESPIFLAIKKEKAGVARYILGNGADLSVKNLNGQNILHFTALSSATEIQRLIGILLSLKAKRAQVDHLGNLPLHYAAGVEGIGTEEMLQSLAGNRSLVNRANRRGRTPLHFAAKIRSEKNIRTLLSLGANPMARDKEGNLAGEIASVLKSRSFSS